MNDSLQALLSSLVKVGVVSSTEGASARVVFPDYDESVSYPLPVLQHGARTTKGHWMPEVDEQVLCLFLPNGSEMGFVLGAYYSEAQPAPNVPSSTVVVAGESVELGDPELSDGDALVRKSDLQSAIDDIMEQVDAINTDLFGQIGAGGGPSGPPFEWTNSTSTPSAKSSSKVFSS